MTAEMEGVWEAITFHQKDPIIAHVFESTRIVTGETMQTILGIFGGAESVEASNEE